VCVCVYVVAAAKTSELKLVTELTETEMQIQVILLCRLIITRCPCHIVPLGQIVILKINQFKTCKMQEITVVEKHEGGEAVTTGTS